MIVDHVFRIYAGADSGCDGSLGGIASGMCAWLGTCNRPAADHARSTRSNMRRQRRTP